MFEQEQKDCWLSWLKNQAIPLWSTKGFNKEYSLFNERLAFDGKPCNPSMMRVMPQMRQISCFASLSTWPYFKLDSRERWLDLANSTFKTVTALYKKADGKPGWAFAINPKTKEVNSGRDLYAHSFVLFAYAKLGLAYTHFKKTTLLDDLRIQAKQEMKDIVELFHLSFLHGSLDTCEVEFIPSKNEHGQNPYMHLLEAAIELFKAFRDQEYLLYARRIVEFLLPKFEASKGLVIEQFDQSWKAIKAPGMNGVEPGHLIEWCWLLKELSELDPSFTSESIRSKWSNFAFKNGICRRRSVVWDGVLESGKDKIQTSRLWPQTEFLRWASIQSEDSAELVKFVTKLNNKLFTSWFLDELKGGWCDRLDKDGVNTTEWMPATSFYHVLGAASAILSRK